MYSFRHGNYEEAKGTSEHQDIALSRVWTSTHKWGARSAERFCLGYWCLHRLELETFNQGHTSAETVQNQAMVPIAIQPKGVHPIHHPHASRFCFALCLARILTFRRQGQRHVMQRNDTRNSSRYDNLGTDYSDPDVCGLRVDEFSRCGCSR